MTEDIGNQLPKRKMLSGEGTCGFTGEGCYKTKDQKNGLLVVRMVLWIINICLVICATDVDCLFEDQEKRSDGMEVCSSSL